MEQQGTENKELRITRLEEEIWEAKETIWRMTLENVDQEKINNTAAYIRYLEREYQEVSFL